MTPPLLPRPTQLSPQHAAYAALGGRAVTAHPVLVRRLGPATAILLGQLLYWQGKKAPGETVFKTIEEMEEETGLTRSQQDTAIRRAEDLGLLSVSVRGVPAKRHFLMQVEGFQQLGLRDLSKLSSRIPTSSVEGSPQTTSESTQESTTETTAEREVELARNSRALDRVRAELIAKGILRNPRGGDHA